MNRKGFSLSNWAEGAVIVIIFILCIGIIITNMNAKYGTNNDPTFGISSNSTKTAFNNYQSQLQTGLAGDASTNTLTGGINLLSAWGMAKAGFNLITDFVTGVWITNGMALIGLGQAGIILAWGLRILFVFSLIFILIRLIFKVNP